MAARMKGDLHVIHVQSDEHSDAKALEPLRQLVEDVGGVWHEVPGRPGAHGGQVRPRPPDHPDRGGATRRSRFEEVSRVRCAQDPPLAAESGIDVHVIARRNSREADRAERLEHDGEVR